MLTIVVEVATFSVHVLTAAIAVVNLLVITVAFATFSVNVLNITVALQNLVFTC